MYGRVRVPARTRSRYQGRHLAREDEAHGRRQPPGPATMPAGKIGLPAVMALQRSLGNAGTGRALLIAGHPGTANLVLQRADEDEELLKQKEDAQRAEQAQATAEAGAAETTQAAAPGEVPAAAQATAVNAAREAATADQAAAEQEQVESQAEVEAREAEQAEEQEQKAARDAEAARIEAPAAQETAPGEVPAEGSQQAEQPPLPAIEDEGGPFPGVGRAGGSINLTGRTRASFRYSFSIENERVEPGSACAGCGRRDPCVHVTGNLVITFSVTTRVTLPRVPRGLTACQRERVRAAIRDTLSPHEDEHVAAFETYNGTVTLPFDEEMCRSRYGRFIRNMARDEERTRRADAQAASDALDPFRVDVDLDCTDE
ncbi:MAG: hypothetical protein KJ053_01600 [Dehalococcoidia bacterium]|nr:hypothetical protein [Dehalococcoidia bacterium]